MFVRHGLAWVGPTSASQTKQFEKSAANYGRMRQQILGDTETENG
jgi:hypothetical protein